MKAFDAAFVLYRHGEKSEALGILKNLWGQNLPPSMEFKVFGALVEVWAEQAPLHVADFLEEVIHGRENFEAFCSRRSLAEQATLSDWLGQIKLHVEDHQGAFDALSAAASIGRDTSLLWAHLGSLYLRNSDLELALRYLRRSLQLYRQLDLSIINGRDQPFGFFIGRHPLGTEFGLESYLALLLKATKIAKSQKNLKSVRELVVEMIHQFPEERRLPQIRLMMERAIVESSIGAGKSQQIPIRNYQI